VQSHCSALEPKKQGYAAKYANEAKQFIAALRPAGLPTTVVYPFGGGDLISALTVYPDATEVTTISLEHGGDPRRIRGLNGKELAGSLQVLRKKIWGLLVADNSTTANLQAAQHSDIPGQLAFFLVALAIHGYEPVSLRYFKLNPDGSLHYLTAAEIQAMEETQATTLRGSWASPDMSVAFSHMELVFLAVGASPDAPVRVHRHFAANLADTAFEADPSLLRHLEAKGRVSAMTKAASYLLWREEFSKIRDYLLAHMDFMISDSTGVPPKYAEKAGFELLTYGTFTGSFLGASEDHNRDFRRIWKAQPKRPLAFRFGYIDANSHYHMLIARRPAAAATSAAAAP